MIVSEIAIASTELVYMGISLTNVKLDACCGGGVVGDLAADVADPAREEPLGGEHDREGDPV